MSFKDLDIFPKVYEDHSKKTTFSGTVTVVCIAIMTYLLVFQTIGYLATPARQRLGVDQRPLPTFENGTLDWDRIQRVVIHIDIEFPSLPCPVIDFQVLDAFKDKQLSSFTKLKLKRIGKDGKIIKLKKNETDQSTTCGSCYGMKSGCCNTCKDVKNAFKAKGRPIPPLSTIRQCKDDVISFQNIKDEKCHMYGTITVPSTRSTLVISTGDSFDDEKNSSSALGIGMDDFNLTHKINTLYVENKYGDKPLDGLIKVQESRGRYKGIYYLRTLREKKSSSQVYRITATHYDRYRDSATEKFPGIYFHFDISPIIVEYKKDVSVLHFIVDLMAILGGIYSLGSLLDHVSEGRSANKVKSFIVS
jgi:hypothetical protein